ncbi:PAS domain S-box-containing protein/diguanylate cyclase (GGDEF)-like protein [Pseudoduganella flava]|uniref:PAS domain S-box-containing protein/diguanylate cyclase (GGDEF)-like protein n=1 Tax=Pseudoduganella flava TaxID=871742 RepID=A0A562PN78_9BURK|nr:EAL domain-containing protein [Pseudoduganella flava]TWI45818.1 PAS domain S-box-containing protein/diguanylate cyclase (GGDEF)-like protein [Pseudoduganella flava]
MISRQHGPLLANLLLAAAYAATGCIGLELALAPGFATPLFLPAGIALAALVTGGPALLPGVAAGAFLMNLISLPRATGLSAGLLTGGAVAAAVAAALQAYVAMHAFNRWVRPEIGAGRDVLRFLVLAPALSLTSSTLSLCALALLGVLSGHDLPATWLAWWMGDALGMLIAAPLAWIAFGQPRALWRRRRWTVGAPLLVLTALFVVIFLQVRRWEWNQQTQQIQLKAQQAADMVQAQLSEHERFLFAMASAINSHGRNIRQQDFHNLARGYHARHREILSMSWLKPVAGTERAAFEAWAREKIDPTFAIREPDENGGLRTAPERDEYVVATYIEPRSNRLYSGLDALSEPLRAAAVQLAMTSSEPVASAPLKLFHPDLYKGVSLLQAVRSDDGSPVGVLLISLELNRYLGGAVREAGFPHLQAALRDAATGDLLSPPLAHADAAGVFHRTLHFGGRAYQLTLAPAPADAVQLQGWRSWSVLAAGLLLTSLLGGLLLQSSGEQAAVRAQVEESTAQLQEREARLQAILDNAADAILTIARDGMLIGANVAAGRLFGYAPEAMAGLPLARLLPVAQDDTAAGLLARIAAAGTREHEATGWRSDGAAFPLAISASAVDLPGERLFVAILHDLTEQRRAQERIYRLAHNDPLTGLENRLSLNLRLEQLLTQARRNHGGAAVMFLDLDHFKKINDTHGHQVGDQLLQAAANRLRELLPDVDTLARLGGDEFIVVTAGLTPDAASHMAARIVEALAAPYPLQGLTVHSGASVGVAMYPVDGADSATLLRHADTAMYAAKSRGRGNFQFFSNDMNAATHERLLLESRLWQALEQQEFELYLQPQVDLPSGALIGAEALVRWHHPELGTVGPDRFIPIAEESGLILPLGEWALRRAVALLERWRGIGLGHLRLAVNLSARQCHGDALLGQLDELLATSGIDPALLELEITETAAMQDPELSRALLQQLRARGIRVAIDDFGTGYSSLSYLKLFELDRIKIDRGFVKDIETDPDDAVIVGATIGLAHSLGLGVIAEGVETAAQAEFLRGKLCDEAQGYLFARPMCVDEFERTASAALGGPRRVNGG